MLNICKASRGSRGKAPESH